MSLSDLLQEKRDHSAKMIPTEVQKVMHNATLALQEERLGEKALSNGDILPNFNLKDSNGKKVSLGSFQSDYLIVSFYRGGWCPYCNLELKALQAILPELSKRNGKLIAITPESPDHSLSTSEKNELTFSVLSDHDNSYAKQLGLAFKLPKDLQEIYKGFNNKC